MWTGNRRETQHLLTLNRSFSEHENLFDFSLKPHIKIIPILVNFLLTIYNQLPFGDWALHLLNSQHGDIFCLPKVMGVYRRHPEGLWSSISERQGKEKRLKFLDILIRNLQDDPELLERLKRTGKVSAKSPNESGKQKSSLKIRIIDTLVHFLKKFR